MRSTTRDRDNDDALTYGLAAVLGGAIALYGYPQIFGLALGALVGVLVPWHNPTDPDDKRHWRKVAAVAIVCALVIAAAYFLVLWDHGVAAELRRFDRNWGIGELSLQTLVDHPWAWLPLFCALALIAYAIVVFIKSR